MAQAETVLLFVAALPEEPRTNEIFRTAYSMNKRVLFPHVDRASRQLRLYAVDDPASDLRPGILGIPEPKPGLPEIPPEGVDWRSYPDWRSTSRVIAWDGAPAITTAFSPNCDPMRPVGPSACVAS